MSNPVTSAQNRTVTQNTSNNRTNSTTSNSDQRTFNGFKTNINIVIDGNPVFGFLAEDGLSIGLKNNWGKLFGDGNLFAALSKSIGQLNALDLNFTSLGDIPNQLKDKAGKFYAAGKAAITGKGSASLGESGGAMTAHVVTNTPMFWTGTEPLDLNITFYQIAESSGDIMNTYRRLLYGASPKIDDPKGVITTVTKTADTFIKVYGLEFRDVVVTNLVCKVKGPFDNVMSPAIGEYNLVAKSQKMVDKDRILEIFKNNPSTVEEDKLIDAVSSNIPIGLSNFGLG